jgi:hypothetical protein
MMMILWMSKWMYMNATNDVMFCANECPYTRLRSHIQTLCSLRNDWNLFAVYFSASPLIFRCKFCIPLGTSFELLRLLFRQNKFCIPLGTSFELLCLIFRRYLALHSHRNDFWVENLRCAPLRTTFCSFVVLCIPLGTTFELLPGFFSFFLHSMVRAQMLHFTFFWGILLFVELNKKRKITSYGPIKNLSPPLERKRVP